MSEIGDTGTIAVMEVFVLLVAVASLLALATRRVTILPYSVALTILGLAVAALALPVQVTVSPEILRAVLVPASSSRPPTGSTSATSSRTSRRWASWPRSACWSPRPPSACSWLP